MANIAYIAQQVVSDEEVIGVKSASATLDDGNFVVATTLSTDSEDGNDVYVATQVAALTDSQLAVVIGDEVYQDSEGNRVPIVDPTQIDYPAGTVVNAYRVKEGRKLVFQETCVDSATRGNIAVGAYFVPKASSYLGDVASDLTGNSTIAFIIEKEVKIQHGITLKDGFLARCVVGY